MMLKYLTRATGKWGSHQPEMGMLQVEYVLGGRLGVQLGCNAFGDVKKAKSETLKREGWTGDECGSG